MKPKRVLPLMLATGLQFLPLTRSVLPVVQSQALAPAWAIVLRVAAGAVALLGSYHTVSGATAINGSRSINGVVGTPYLRRLTTSGETVKSWSADTAPLRSAVYPLTPGLYLTNRTGIIGGIPTEVATATIKITGWENSGNSGRRISAFFTVKVTPPGSPVITREPQNLKIISGQDAAFSVTANGVEPLSYQWQWNGAPLAGETTAALSLAHAQPAHAGAYSVVVTNVVYAITSSVATLTVTPDLVKPVVTITSPSAARTIVTSNTFRMAGQARDNVGLSNVCIIPASGEAIIATGTTNWFTWVDLAPGTNLFRLKAVDFSGASSGTNTLRAIVFVVTSPLTLSNTGSGSIVGATNGQPLEVGRGYTLTARPGPDHLFSNWVGSVASASNVLRFTMQTNFMLTAQFVPNPFLVVAGNYHGLYYDPTNIQHGSAGFATVTVLPNGGFSASVRNGIRKIGFTGRFDLEGRATNHVARSGTNALAVELNLDLQGGNLITGRVTDGTWSSSLTAHRVVFQAATNPATLLATNYTLLLPGATDAALAPPGDGFASMKADRSGVATFAGALADASPLAQKSPVSGAGDFPLYVSLYGGKGSIFGWLRLRPTTNIDLAGTANWIRPPGPVPKIYTDGFALSPAVPGSIYTPPGTNRAFDLDTAFVGFHAGNLTEPFTNTVVLGQNNRVTSTSSNTLTMTVTPATGVFAGKATPPGSTRVLPFKGAILQRQGMGGGFFRGTNEFGHVYFGP